MINRPFYSEFAWAYNLIIDSKTESRLNFIKQLIKDYHLAGQINVLDAGCGPGNLSIVLALEGYQVTAIDISEALINVARKQNHEKENPQFIVRNILDINYLNQFDLIVCRGVLNDFINQKEREKIFQIFYKALKRNGILIADVREWAATIERKLSEPVFQKQVNTNKGLLTFRSDTKLNIEEQIMEILEFHQLENESTITINGYEFKMKCWTLKEIKDHCLKSGFVLDKLLGDYDFNTKLGQTDRIVFILKKESDASNSN